MNFFDEWFHSVEIDEAGDDDKPREDRHREQNQCYTQGNGITLLEQMGPPKVGIMFRGSGIHGVILAELIG
jgi:hypothetical protein